MVGFQVVGTSAASALINNCATDASHVCWRHWNRVKDAFRDETNLKTLQMSLGGKSRPPDAKMQANSLAEMVSDGRETRVSSDKA
jgi:hypothetical protein